MPDKTELIKDTKYCEIHNQGRYVDNNYTYCIEKIYVKKLKRFEIRFSLYKDLTGHPEKYIAKSLDVKELEYISLHIDAISKHMFDSEAIGKTPKLLSPSDKTFLSKSPKQNRAESKPEYSNIKRIKEHSKEKYVTRAT